MADQRGPVPEGASDSLEHGHPVAASDRQIRSEDMVYGEGQSIVADGVMVWTHYVQLKEAPLFEWPHDSPILIRGSRTEHAIENGARLRLSKPEAFRHDDGTLISDMEEGVAQLEERHVGAVTVNAPADMIRAQQRDAERSALAVAIGSNTETSTIGTRTETATSSRKTHTYGKNGWILCASIRPSEEAEMKAWRESLMPEYDHVTTIQSPRDFARALAKMVASQLGPLGRGATLTHPLSKQPTKHPSQSVFHGPVAYVDDPYSYVEQAANPFETMLRSVFFKHARFRDQREYRFFVWTESEPEALTIDLEVSPEMLAALQPTAVLPPQTGHAHHGGRQAEPFAVAQEAASDQPAPARAAAPPNDESPGHPDSADANHEERRTIAMPVPLAILIGREQARHAFSYMVRDGDTDPNRAAAAFHAERVAIELLEQLVDPIAAVEWANGVMLIEFKNPDRAGWEGRLAVGPLGAAQYRISVEERTTEVSCDQGWMMAETLVEDLKRHGLEPWPPTDAFGEAVVHLSVPPTDQRAPEEHLSQTSTIRRMTTQNAAGLTDADVDRINAEVESGGDDARITRIVVTYPSGHHFTLSGVRAGLGGTFGQRTTEGSVTLDVSTMHPAATISVHPAKTMPDSSRHQVVLPDGQDTAVAVTATSPDGSTQSNVKIVLKRTGDQE